MNTVKHSASSRAYHNRYNIATQRQAMMQTLQPSAAAIGAQPYQGENSLAAAGPYCNNLEPFLGPPSKAIDHKPSDQFPHEAWFLPDAYMGDQQHTVECLTLLCRTE